MLLTRSPLAPPAEAEGSVRLACLRYAASVCPEPGSNSPSVSLGDRLQVPIPTLFGISLFDCKGAQRHRIRRLLPPSSHRSLASAQAFGQDLSQTESGPAVRFGRIVQTPYRTSCLRHTESIKFHTSRQWRRKARRTVRALPMPRSVAQGFSPSGSVWAGGRSTG